MVRRREILKSAVALAASGWSSADFAAVAPPVDAKLLLKNVVQVYSSMSSYEDRGIVRTHGNGLPHHIDFTTAYKRPSLFRFAFSRSHGYPLLRHVVTQYIVGFDGTSAYFATREDGKAPVVEPMKSLNLAVAKATGISFGSAHLIGRLLLREVTGLSILQLLDARFDDATIVSGCDCYAISARHQQGGRWLFWIEQDTLLIRKVTSSFGTADGPLWEEVRDDIHVNRPIDDGMFRLQA